MNLRSRRAGYIVEMATAAGCIAGACAYGAWVALTDSAKRQVDHWGPDWVVRLLQLGGAAVMNARRRGRTRSTARRASPPCAGRAGGIGACHRTGRTRRARSCSGCRSSASRRRAARDPRALGGASVLFWVPGLREVLLLYGVREATPATIARLVRAGCVVALNPGGLREQIAADSAQEQVLRTGGSASSGSRSNTAAPSSRCTASARIRSTPRTPRGARAARRAVRRLRVGLVVVSGRWGLSAGVLPPSPTPRVSRTSSAAPSTSAARRARPARP